MATNTTYNQLAEQVIILASGGDQSRDSELESEDIILLCKQVASNIIRNEMYAEMVKLNDNLPGFQYLWTTTEVATKIKTGVYTITLPSIPFNLPNDRGIHAVFPDDNLDNPIMYVPYAAQSFVKDALVGELAYSVERDTLRVFNVCGPLKNVTLQLVMVSPDDQGKDDPVFIPPEFQQMIVQEVFEIIMGRPPMDVVNDSKDVK